MEKIEKKLKCYYVEGKGHEELNGVSVIAYNAKDAKKYAWGFLCEWIDWTDMRPRISKNVNIEGLPDGYIFACETDKESWDALYRHVYSGLYYSTCPNCKTEDTDVKEVYDDVFGCSNCEDNLTPESINNPYVKKITAVPKIL